MARGLSTAQSQQIYQLCETRTVSSLEADADLKLTGTAGVKHIARLFSPALVQGSHQTPAIAVDSEVGELKESEGTFGSQGHDVPMMIRVVHRGADLSTVKNKVQEILAKLSVWMATRFPSPSGSDVLDQFLSDAAGWIEMNGSPKIRAVVDDEQDPNPNVWGLVGEFRMTYRLRVQQQ